MRELEIMIGLLLAGFILLLGGYAKRDDKKGLCMITAGMLIVFSTIGYKLYLELELGI